MSKSVITVENLSKVYQISHKGDRPDTLRDSIAGFFQKKLRTKDQEQGTERFHALKDVSFEVTQGEVLGIIGMNGAGKSTLLKILSRITEPTSGRVKISGRVASLLEVGTGFHHELSGRENIFLNGAILGMSRKEVRSKLEQIVDFAGVEKFIDTPVKRYSSGMFVRLAFAVAAHLEPEILLIDEVLSVGDQDFRQRCLGKMKDVSESGRTVIFISHQMGYVNELCHRTVLLDRGTIQRQGPTGEIIKYYQSLLGNSPRKEETTQKGALFLDHFSIRSNFPSKDTQDLEVYLKIAGSPLPSPLSLTFIIKDESGTILTKINYDISGFTFQLLNKTQNIRLKIPNINHYLSSGLYNVDLWIVIPQVEILVKSENIGSFESIGFNHQGRESIPTYSVHGPCNLPMEVNLIDDE
jgi:lipopolysaccharide transport system ATP-binding protein